MSFINVASKLIAFPPVGSSLFRILVLGGRCKHMSKSDCGDLRGQANIGVDLREDWKTKKTRVYKRQ